jgi:putative addiction module component (TIGR02574 family)
MALAPVTKDVLRKAIRLPERERVRVVEGLLASLNGKRERAVDAAWRAEVEARARELRAGTIRPIPWTEVRRRARKRARGKV